MLRKFWFYRKLRDNLGKTRPEIEDYSLTLIERILRHAYSEVPFYRRRWDEAGVSPEDIGSLKDLEKLPVVEKDDVAQDPQDFIAQDYRLQYLRKDFSFSTSSGLDGTDARFYLGSRGRAYRDASMQRLYSLYGIRPYDRVVKFVVSPERYRGVFDTPLQNYYISFFDPLEKQVDKLERVEPRAIQVHPSTLQYLSYREPDIDPDVIISSGEVLDRWTEERASDVFGARVYDVYASEEFGGLAWQCPWNPDHYHVSNDSNVLEAVNSSDRLVSGEYGSAVSTSLSNYMMPLIRFRLDDSINMSSEHACQIPFPVMDGIRGRENKALKADGGTFFSQDIKKIINAVDGVRRFKIFEEGEGYRVVVDKAPGHDGEEVEGEVSERAEGYLKETVTVDLEELDLDKRQKCTPFTPLE